MNDKSATQEVFHLHQDYELDIPLRSLFEARMVAELATVIAEILIEEVDEL